jgi:hypothetical protein
VSDTVAATQTASLVRVSKGRCTIRCPFCGGQHSHPKANMGSAATLAPCHQPDRDELRTYAIPTHLETRTHP